VLTTPCTTGSQAWTATTLAAGPDARISRSTENTLVGDDIFNSTAEDQVRKWSAKRGQARQFHVDIQNDGTEAGDFSVKGCGNSRGFKVTYRYGGGNVTSAVVAGDLDTNQLDPDEADTVFMTIKPTRKAKPGKVKSCKVTTRSIHGLVDAVKAELKVKRG
jgi:uncharacterized membrane protein